ncbi:MAG: helix-turn-helix domain-containing protein [Anaerolineaceae bacterium]|nr:helix-turn-helix domain-containing protein [Anaerolineaceae bacterium]
MNQPELGLIVTEKRQASGLTQEQLAERCQVSTRTIQRIESGEVDPRAFTRQNLSTILEFDFGAQNEENETLWLTLLHLSSCLCIFFIPLIIWSWKKRSSHKIDHQGQLVLNFQITMTIVLVSAALLMMIVPPLVFVFLQGSEGPIRMINIALVSMTVIPLIGLGVFCFIQGIRNLIRMHTDKPIHYPLSIQFIK